MKSISDNFRNPSFLIFTSVKDLKTEVSSGLQFFDSACSLYSLGLSSSLNLADRVPGPKNLKQIIERNMPIAK